MLVAQCLLFHRNARSRSSMLVAQCFNFAYSVPKAHATSMTQRATDIFSPRPLQIEVIVQEWKKLLKGRRANVAVESEDDDSDDGGLDHEGWCKQS